MKYGVCSWIFGGEPLAGTAERLATLGYDGVELAGDLEKYKAAEVKAVMDDHGLEVLSLTPDNVDPAHPDTAVREEALDYYLRLLDFAAELGGPIVSCHGAVGRVRAVTSYEEERRVYVDSVQRIGRRAEALGLQVAMEVLNRYEAHLLCTAAETIRFVETVGCASVGILLDAYHMNIEEADLRSAVLAARDHLVLFHAADSNRKAVGRGHTDFLGLMRTLSEIGYDRSIIVECTAPGPDPFTPVKGEGWKDEVYRYVDESLRVLRTFEGLV